MNRSTHLIAVGLVLTAATSGAAQMNRLFNPPGSRYVVKQTERAITATFSPNGTSSDGLHRFQATIKLYDAPPTAGPYIQSNLLQVSGWCEPDTNPSSDANLRRKIKFVGRNVGSAGAGRFVVIGFLQAAGADGTTRQPHKLVIRMVRLRATTPLDGDNPCDSAGDEVMEEEIDEGSGPSYP